MAELLVAELVLGDVVVVVWVLDGVLVEVDVLVVVGDELDVEVEVVVVLWLQFFLATSASFDAPCRRLATSLLLTP